MAIQWNDVRANFNDANSAMGNAQRGLSQAGTVFGELRKAILDEEQRAIENDYRQKVFDENVRQFGLQYGLDQDRLAEQIRAAQADEAHDAAVLEETRRANQEKEKIDRINAANQAAYQQGLLKNSRDRLAFDRDQWNAEQDRIKRNDDARILTFDAMNNIGKSAERLDELTKGKEQLTTEYSKIKSLSDDQFKTIYPNQSKNDVLNRISDDLNKTTALTTFHQRVINSNGSSTLISDASKALYADLGGIDKETPTTIALYKGAEQEQAAYQAKIDAQKKEKDFEIKFNTGLPKLIREQFPNMKENEVTALAATMSKEANDNPNTPKSQIFYNIINKVQYEKPSVFGLFGDNYSLREDSSTTNTSPSTTSSIVKDRSEQIKNLVRDKSVSSIEELPPNLKNSYNTDVNNLLAQRRRSSDYKGDKKELEDINKSLTKEYLSRYNESLNEDSGATPEEIKEMLSRFSDKELQLLGFKSRNIDKLTKKDIAILEATGKSYLSTARRFVNERKMYMY